MDKQKGTFPEKVFISAHLKEGDDEEEKVRVPPELLEEEFRGKWKKAIFGSAARNRKSWEKSVVTIFLKRIPLQNIASPNYALLLFWCISVLTTPRTTPPLLGLNTAFIDR